MCLWAPLSPDLTQMAPLGYRLGYRLDATSYFGFDGCISPMSYPKLEQSQDPVAFRSMANNGNLPYRFSLPARVLHRKQKTYRFSGPERTIWWFSKESQLGGPFWDIYETSDLQIRPYIDNIYIYIYIYIYIICPSWWAAACYVGEMLQAACFAGALSVSFWCRRAHLANHRQILENRYPAEGCSIWRARPLDLPLAVLAQLAHQALQEFLLRRTVSATERPEIPKN